MLQIRKSVFETNSSSSHTLVITNTEETVRRRLPYNYLLKLSDRFSGWTFEEDLFTNEFGKEEQTIETKLDYVYTYCVAKPNLRKAFKLAMKILQRDSEVIIDYDQTDYDNTRYYNTAMDYLYENMYYINHESNDILDQEFDACIGVEECASKIYDIITLPKYIIYSNKPSINDENEADN
jgi:hypothetical protein